MGWTDKIKDIIGELRASGKNEDEVEELVQQAAEKATCRLNDILEVTETARGSSQQNINNWRRMHGLPMQRKGKKRR